MKFTSTIPLLLQCLTLTSSTSVVAEANPLNNLFMMMGSSNKDRMQMGRTAKQQQEADCCEQLEAAKSARLLAEQESQDALKQLEQMKEDYNHRIQQLTAASDTTESLKALQEEFHHQKTEMKQHFGEQTAHLRSLLEQKEAEKMKLQEKLERTTAEQELVLEKKIQEAAAQWKRGLDVQEMQGDYQRQVQELEKTTAQAQAELKEQQVAAQAAIQARDIVTGEKLALQKLYDHLERKYENMITQLDTATEKYIQENFEKVVQEKLDLANGEWESKLEELRVKSQALLEEAEMRTQKELEDARLVSEKVQTELREQLAAKEEEHEREFKEYSEKLAESEKTVKDMRAQVEKTEQELKTVKQTLAKTKQTVTELEAANQKLELQLQSTDKKRKQAVKDAEYWEHKFHNRAYLNISYIQEGARSAMHAAQETTKQKYDGAKEKATKYYRQQRKAVEKVSEPYVNKSKVMYEAHMRKHVDLAVETARPHVAPLVDKVMQASRDGMGLVKNASDDVFKSLVQQYKTLCSEAIKLAKNPDQERMMKKACRRPAKAVSNILKVIGVIVLILCRRLIWKLFVFAIRSVVGIIWFFSPLRLFLGLFTSASPHPSGAGNNEKVTNTAQ